MSRLAAAFAAAGKAKQVAIIPYIPFGYPSLDASEIIITALIEAGAAAIELGIPFSDPTADGPVIQRASHIALQNGAKLSGALSLIEKLRRDGVNIPILLMGYCNPFLAFGLAKLANRGKGIIDGLIVPDLPVEEAGAWAQHLRFVDLDLIGFVAPTTPLPRAALTIAVSSGFIYVIAATGVTGSRANLADRLGPMLVDLRRLTDLPLAIGFGISKPDHVTSLRGQSDGIIIGSALIEAIEKNPYQPDRAAYDFLKPFVEAARRT